MKRPFRKRSYLLLEVLCCLALISLVLFPLLKPCYRLYKEKHQQVTLLKCGITEKLALAEVKRCIYMQEFTYEMLLGGCTATFEIDGVTCQAALHTIDSTKKPSLKRMGLLVEVTLRCGGSEERKHQLFVEGVFQ